MVPAAALIFAALTAASGVGSFHRQRVLPVGSSPPSLSLAPDKATARGRACLASPTGPQYVINPADYGADPTGTTDATAVLQQCVNLLWNASRSGSILARTQHQLDLGGATLDLAGGIFLLSSPVVFPEGGARNFQVRGGTLRAGGNFPMTGFLFELNYSESSYVENAAFHDVVFDGGEHLRGGGLLSVENLHMRVQGCWFLRFGTVGLSVLNGHEFYVDDTYASQVRFQLRTLLPVSCDEVYMLLRVLACCLSVVCTLLQPAGRVCYRVLQSSFSADVNTHIVLHVRQHQHHQHDSSL